MTDASNCNADALNSAHSPARLMLSELAAQNHCDCSITMRAFFSDASGEGNFAWTTILAWCATPRELGDMIVFECEDHAAHFQTVWKAFIGLHSVVWVKGDK